MPCKPQPEIECCRNHLHVRVTLQQIERPLHTESHCTPIQPLQLLGTDSYGDDPRKAAGVSFCPNPWPLLSASCCSINSRVNLWSPVLDEARAKYEHVFLHRGSLETGDHANAKSQSPSSQTLNRVVFLQIPTSRGIFNRICRRLNCQRYASSLRFECTIRGNTCRRLHEFTTFLQPIANNLRNLSASPIGTYES